ncbi:MAG TPA: cation transporter [Ilumatobacteraceae bacterium]|nr:cation transporter [Ilumatobacteraceae bacterium]
MTTSRSSYHLPGMDCGAEEQLVRLALDGLEGVEHVAVDLGHRTVSVHHTGETQHIDAALADLGLGANLVERQAAPDSPQGADDRTERTALAVALAINAVFFVGEATAGLISGSMGLLADALDMGADAAVYAISLVAVGGSQLRKRRLARTSGWLQLGLAALGLVEVVRRFALDEPPPDVRTMIVVSLLALVGNVVALVLLHRVRSADVHIQASWIFTANDVKINLLVIMAAIAVAATDSPMPDLVVGALVFAIVANGARRILRLSR